MIVFDLDKNKTTYVLLKCTADAAKKQLKGADETQISPSTFTIYLQAMAKYSFDLYGVGAKRFPNLRSGIKDALYKEVAHDHDLSLTITNVKSGKCMYDGFAYMAPWWLEKQYPKEYALLETPKTEAMKNFKIKMELLLKDTDQEHIDFKCLTGDRRPANIYRYDFDSLGPRKPVDATDVFTITFQLPVLAAPYVFSKPFVTLSHVPLTALPKEWLKWDDTLLKMEIIVPHVRLSTGTSIHGVQQNGLLDLWFD